MNELLNNFINQIDDANKIQEMSVEEFSKLVKANRLITEEDGKKLIESFKKISSKKDSEDESSDSEQRKKKYRQQHKESATNIQNKEEKTIKDKEKEDDSLER